jgi:hypothetical protein
LPLRSSIGPRAGIYKAYGQRYWLAYKEILVINNLDIEKPGQQVPAKRYKYPGNNVPALKKTIHLRSLLLKNNKPDISIKNTGKYRTQ